MEISITSLVPGKRYSCKSGDLIYFDCTFCNERTPTWIDFFHESRYEAICAVCSSIRKLNRFVLHEKCQIHVECVGFTSHGAHRSAVVREINNLDRHREFPLLIVFWCSEPIEHICGQAIEASP